MGRHRELSRELRTLATTDPDPDRQSPPLRRIDAGRTRAGAAPRRRAAVAGHHRHRPLQADQRPLRPPDGDQALTGLVGEIQRSPATPISSPARLGGEGVRPSPAHTNVAGAHEFADASGTWSKSTRSPSEGQPPLMITVGRRRRAACRRRRFRPVMGRADQALC